MTTDSSAREYLDGDRLAATKRFNDAYINTSRAFKFPLGFRFSHAGLSDTESYTLGRLISIGAEWLDKNPGKTPASSEFQAFYETVKPLAGTTDNTFGILCDILTEVKEKGFDGYVADLRKQKAAAAQAGGMDR